jgi:hypothetical protein
VVVRLQWHYRLSMIAILIKNPFQGVTATSPAPCCAFPLPMCGAAGSGSGGEEHTPLVW